MFATAFSQNHHKCFLFREPSAVDTQDTATFPLKPHSRHFPGIPSRTPGGRHQGALPRPAPELPRRQRAGMVSDGGPGLARGPGPGTRYRGARCEPSPGPGGCGGQAARGAADPFLTAAGQRAPAVRSWFVPWEQRLGAEGEAGWSCLIFAS